MTSTTHARGAAALDAGRALELVRASGGSESATAALAMFEQLEAAGVQLEALEMCIMLWSRALDGLGTGPVPAARLARLDADMAFEMQTAPVMGGWLAALRRDVREAAIWIARSAAHAGAYDLDHDAVDEGARTADPPLEFPLGAQLAGGAYTITDWLRGSRNAAWVAPPPAAGQGAAW